jgi:hypothetical protein
MNTKDQLSPRRKPTRLALLLLAFAAVGLLIWLPATGSLAQQTPSRQLVRTPVKEWPGKAKRWALVIGVDQYRDGNISALRGAANDAATLARALTQYAGFPADQVILLATDQPEERQPTRINILSYLSNIAAAVPKDGLLLVSFAGHGLERGGQAYLIPSDARLTDDISLLEESAVSVQRMHDRIRLTGVSQVVVLLDACRNDPGGRADAPNNLTTAYTKGFDFDVRNREVQAFATIYATAVGQRAFEYVEKKQGYFSWAVVEGLKGAAANERGEVTLAALVKYVQDTVPKRVAIDLGAGKQQRPFANIDGYMAADLVVAVGPPPGVADANATSNETRTDSRAMELSFWDSVKNSTNVDDFKAYLEKYPEGQFASLAKNKIKNLEAVAPPEPKASGDSMPELAFWGSVKNSTNAEDFEAYLKKYPKGEFVDLANNRIASLDALRRENERINDAKRAAAQPKLFVGRFGYKIGWTGFNWNGKLMVAPGRIEFVCEKGGDSCGEGKSVPLGCAAFASAVNDKSLIKEIELKSTRYRFTSSSPAEAAAALAAVRSVCRTP